MTAHARLSPSSCDRWSTCTASVEWVEKLRARGDIPAEESSVWAAEGTVAHAVREMCLELGLDAHHFVGSVMGADGYTFTVDESMASHLQGGIDWVREHTASPDIEIRVDLSPWLPGQFGTCDTGWLGTLAEPVLDTDTGRWVEVKRDALYISDLKYGAGEPVDARGNKQMRLYALGYWHFKGRPKIDTVVMNIDQPRAGGMKFWEIPFDDLLAFGEEMKAVYRSISRGKVEFAPSKKACRWCEAKFAPGGCPARNDWLLKMIYEDPADSEPLLIDAARITPEKRWHIVQHASEVRALLAQLHEDSLAAALAGNPDHGSKAVEGDLGDRRFKPGDEIFADALLATALGDAAYKPRQLIGFTEIDKLVKPGRKKKGHPETWAALSELVDRPQGKPKLVPADHQKPALVAYEDDFDDL